MTSDPDDAELIRRVLAGSTDACAELIRLYEDRLTRVVVAVLGGEEGAEDVLQEAFLRAFAGLDSFGGRSGFKTWLYRIAMNEAFRFREVRSRERIKPFSSLPDEVSREVLARPSPGSGRLEDRELAVQLLDALPRPYREALVLRHVEGLSYVEIAEVMKTTTGQVGSLLHRARQLLLERFPQRVE